MTGTFVVSLLAVIVCTTANAAEWSDDRPNILFLIADDMQADAIGALGNETVFTPVLDELVKEGFSFRRTYCMGSNSGAVCGPSRAMILTGLGLEAAMGNGKRLQPRTGATALAGTAPPCRVSHVRHRQMAQRKTGVQSVL